MTTAQQWPMYAWAATVTLAVLAAVWTATNRGWVRSVLPLEHVAGAALVGLFGWEALVQLPGSVMGYWNLTAGLGDVRGIEGPQAYVMAQVMFVVAAGFAVGGILRGRTWGSVLGIGLAFARAVWSGLVLLETTVTHGGIMGFDTYIGVLSAHIGMRVMPALAVVALLAWPFVRPPTAYVDSSG